MSNLLSLIDELEGQVAELQRMVFDLKNHAIRPPVKPEPAMRRLGLSPGKKSDCQGEFIPYSYCLIHGAGRGPCTKDHGNLDRINEPWL